MHAYVRGRGITSGNPLPAVDWAGQRRWKDAMRTKRKPGNRLYSSPEWLAVRDMVLVRDQYLCQLRGPRCLGVADRVDHYVPRSKGGSNHPSNLYAACNLCNSSKKDSLPEPVATVNW